MHNVAISSDHTSYTARSGKNLPAQSKNAAVSKNKDLSLSGPLPLQAATDKVSISDESRQYSSKTSSQPSSQPMFKSLDKQENLIEFGKIVLGGSNQIQEWEAKGLSITDETYLNAAAEYLEGFKALLENGDPKPQGLAINKHQVVMDSQPTPAWFIAEYQNTLSALDTEHAKAFEQGASYYISNHSTHNATAIKTYHELSA
jgi:hypothetical protein